jgi:hypothetical protein
MVGDAMPSLLGACHVELGMISLGRGEGPSRPRVARVVGRLLDRTNELAKSCRSQGSGRASLA